MLQKKARKFYISGGLAAAIALLIFLNSAGWLEWPKKILYRGSVPILKPFEIAGKRAAGFLKMLSSVRDLMKENSRLKQENQQLILRVSGLAELAQQNKMLRDQLQIRPSLEAKMLIADLIGFDPGNLGQYFLINKGQREGVKINQAVICAGGFLVGKIIEVKENFSQAVALTDSGSSIFALTQETRIGGVVRGDYGLGLFLDMVPSEKIIKGDETVISSGLDEGIPKGLVIGQIEGKISKESEVFQKFKIKPAVNYKEAESVFIILGDE
jgi:rod shape-determining protein MreC